MPPLDFSQALPLTAPEPVCLPCDDNVDSGLVTPNAAAIEHKSSRLPVDQAWRANASLSLRPQQLYASYGQWVVASTGHVRAPPAASKGDVVRGLWSCCKQTGRNAPGCVRGPHAFDHAQCAQCGEYIPTDVWGSSACRHHPASPSPSRWGSVVFNCCGTTGLDGTKWRREFELTQWVSDRNERIESEAPPPRRQATSSMALTLGISSPAQHAARLAKRLDRSTGCAVGSHVPVQPPTEEEVALRCTGCGHTVADERCPTCCSILHQCLQCFRMVPVMAEEDDEDDEGDDRRTGGVDRNGAPPIKYALAGREPRALANAADTCRFHPGTWCESRTRSAGGPQPRETALCPHTGCGLRHPSAAAVGLHAARCEFKLVECPNMCVRSADGAPLVVRYGDLDEHLAACSEAMVACPNAGLGCPVQLRRRLMADHLGGECAYTQRTCPRACGALLARGDIGSHLANDCPEELVVCPYGCGHVARRREWTSTAGDAHRSTCPRASAECELCGVDVFPHTWMAIHLKTECGAWPVPCRRCGESVVRMRQVEHEAECLQRAVLIAWRALVVARRAAKVSQHRHAPALHAPLLPTVKEEDEAEARSMSDTPARSAVGPEILSAESTIAPAGPDDDDHEDDGHVARLAMLEAQVLHTESRVQRLRARNAARQAASASHPASAPLASSPEEQPGPSTPQPNAVHLDAERVVGCGHPRCNVDIHSLSARALLRHKSTCPFRMVVCQRRGCAREMPAHLLSAHAADDCPRRPVACPYGCGQTRLPYESVHSAEGEHARTCPALVVTCTHGCGKRLARSAMCNHEELCPMRSELCHYGCNKSIRRKDLPAHRDVCAALHAPKRFPLCDGYCLRRCPLGYDQLDHARIRAGKQPAGPPKLKANQRTPAGQEYLKAAHIALPAQPVYWAPPAYRRPRTSPAAAQRRLRVERATQMLQEHHSWAPEWVLESAHVLPL